MQLLLVEDELEIQSFLKHSLAEAGYQVDAAADGKTCLLYTSLFEPAHAIIHGASCREDQHWGTHAKLA